jgi:hypothetical protein
MALTNFVDQTTVIDASWLNGIDATVNGALEGATTAAQILSILGISNPVILLASNPSLIVSANSSGVVSSFASATGQAQLYSGSTLNPTGVVFSLGTLTNVTGTVNATTGVYAFTGMTQNTGSMVVNALYQGTTYSITITITKAIAGATGASGSGLQAVFTPPTLTVLANANGVIPSGNYAAAVSQCSIFNGSVNVTSQCTFTGTPTTGIIASINSTGLVSVSNISGVVSGSYTVTASYSGGQVTAVLGIQVIQAGYQIVTSTGAVTNPYEGEIVFDSTDGQLYRYHSGAWTVAVPAVNITGTITGTQISNGAISTPQLAANSVTASQIQTGTITSTQIASGTITANNIQTGTITAAQIASNSITASQLATGTITATSGVIANLAVGTLQIASGAITGLGYANQTSTFNFTANNNTANYYDNANCFLTINLAYATTVIITAYQAYTIGSGASSWSNGALGGIYAYTTGAGQVLMSGLLKINSSYYSSQNGVFIIALPSGTSTIQTSVNANNSTSPTGTNVAGTIINAQIIAQWSYK